MTLVRSLAVAALVALATSAVTAAGAGMMFAGRASAPAMTLQGMPMKSGGGATSDSKPLPRPQQPPSSSRTPRCTKVTYPCGANTRCTGFLCQ
jgi:hypothetical protein